MRAKELTVRRPSTSLAAAEHAVPRRDRLGPIAEPQAVAQIALLEANAAGALGPHVTANDLTLETKPRIVSADGGTGHLAVFSVS